MTDIALTIIETAAKHLGALESGASLTDDEAQDGLRALNGMLGVWALEGLPLYGETLTTHTLVAGTPDYTIGPSGADITAARPAKEPRGAWVRDGNNVDRRIREIVPFKRYQDIALKATQGPYADVLAIDPGAVTSTLYLYPTPSAGYTLRLLYEALLSFATLDTAFSLPPGYQAAIEYNLAVWLAPQFELEASADVYRIADKSLKSIERINAAARVGPRTTDVPRMPGRMGGGGGYNINSDGWR